MSKDSKSQVRRKSIQKKDLLDAEAKIIATSIFQFEELKLKKDLSWYLKLLLKT